MSRLLPGYHHPQEGPFFMRVWWVNQNLTHRHELAGGYLWSPKSKRNGNRNPFYETMRGVAPGDLILSFLDTRLVAIGIAASNCFEAPRPAEFGSAGRKWDDIGWRVQVNFHRLSQQIRPSDHMNVLRRLLPERYAPLTGEGRGNQGLYLTELLAPLAEALLGLIGAEADAVRVAASGFPDGIVKDANAEVEQWEHHLEAKLDADQAIPATNREALIIARRGQGLFKQRVMAIEQRCRITGVDNPVHLRASHCKPWRDSTNEERLLAENGLLLTPSIDHLFDRGFISFENSGELIIAPVADWASLGRMGVPVGRVFNVGGFTDGQKHFLEYHRGSVLLRAARGHARRDAQGAGGST